MGSFSQTRPVSLSNTAASSKSDRIFQREEPSIWLSQLFRFCARVLAATARTTAKSTSLRIVMAIFLLHTGRDENGKTFRGRTGRPEDRDSDRQRFPPRGAHWPDWMKLAQ